MSMLGKRSSNPNNQHASSWSSSAATNDGLAHHRPCIDVPIKAVLDANFEELARQYPAFGVAWNEVEGNRKAALKQKNGLLSAHITQDFSIALTKALLQNFWNISISHVPLHHLCPPVPNRYFYVRWMQHDILPLSGDPLYFDNSNNKNPIMASHNYVGLDIGTGAMAIYPLLFAASCPQLTQMWACDIDREALQWAQGNIDSNPVLKQPLTLVQVSPSERQARKSAKEASAAAAESVVNTNTNVMPMRNLSAATFGPRNDFPVGPLRQCLETIAVAAASSSSARPHMIDFCMTNPPFYDHHGAPPSSQRRHGNHRDHPHTPAPMTTHEGRYPGGERCFIMDMLVDGLYYYIVQQQRSQLPPKGRLPRWTSTMCGKKKTWVKVQHIVTQLMGPAHVVGTEFGPGQMTRWFLAWTFDRPNVRSPWAKMEPLVINVNMAATAYPASEEDKDEDGDEDDVDVCRRIENYLRSFPSERSFTGVEFSCTVSPCRRQLQITEPHPMPPPWKGDQALPEDIQRILKHHMDPSWRMAFLPVQGHFLMDIQIDNLPGSTSEFRVNVQAYQHSNHGKKCVDRIQSQLPGDISRNSRKWRRKFKRLHAATTTNMDESA